MVSKVNKSDTSEANSDTENSETDRNDLDKNENASEKGQTNPSTKPGSSTQAAILYLGFAGELEEENQRKVASEAQNKPLNNPVIYLDSENTEPKETRNFSPHDKRSSILSIPIIYLQLLHQSILEVNTQNDTEFTRETFLKILSTLRHDIEQYLIKNNPPEKRKKIAKSIQEFLLVQEADFSSTIPSVNAKLLDYMKQLRAISYSKKPGDLRSLLGTTLAALAMMKDHTIEYSRSQPGNLDYRKK